MAPVTIYNLNYMGYKMGEVQYDSTTNKVKYKQSDETFTDWSDVNYTNLLTNYGILTFIDSVVELVINGAIYYTVNVTGSPYKKMYMTSDDPDNLPSNTYYYNESLNEYYYEKNDTLTQFDLYEIENILTMYNYNDGTEITCTVDGIVKLKSTTPIYQTLQLRIGATLFDGIKKYYRDKTYEFLSSKYSSLDDLIIAIRDKYNITIENDTTMVLEDSTTNNTVEVIDASKYVKNITSTYNLYRTNTLLGEVQYDSSTNKVKYEKSDGSFSDWSDVDHTNLLEYYNIYITYNEKVKITDADDNEIYSWTITSTPYDRLGVFVNGVLCDEEHFYRYKREYYYSFLDGTSTKFTVRDLDTILVEKFNYTLADGDSVKLTDDGKEYNLTYPNSLMLYLMVDTNKFEDIKHYDVYYKDASKTDIYVVDDQFFDEAGLINYYKNNKNVTISDTTSVILYKLDGSVYKTINAGSTTTTSTVKQIPLTYTMSGVGTHNCTFLEYHTDDQKYYYNYNNTTMPIELTNLLDILTALYSISITEGDTIHIKYSDSDFSVDETFTVVLDTGITVTYYDYNGNEKTTTKYSYNDTDDSFKDETFNVTYTAEELMTLLSTTTMNVYLGDHTNSENLFAEFVEGGWKWVDLQYYTNDTDASTVRCLKKSNEIKINQTETTTYDLNELPKLNFYDVFKVNRYYLRPLSIDKNEYDVSLIDLTVLYQDRHVSSNYNCLTNSSRDFFVELNGTYYMKTTDELVERFAEVKHYILVTGDVLVLTNATGDENITINNGWVRCNWYTDLKMSTQINGNTKAIFNKNYDPNDYDSPILYEADDDNEETPFYTSSDNYNLSDLDYDDNAIVDLDGNTLFVSSTLN